VELEVAFGQVLRRLRTERGLTQEGLALDAGIARNYVSLLELGQYGASLNMIFKLAGALGVLPEDLVRMAREIEEMDSLS